MIKQFIVPSYPYDAQNPDTLSPEVQKKVLDAFEVFDHEQNKTVDAREIGTIIRSLGTFLYFLLINLKIIRIFNIHQRIPQFYFSSIFNRLLPN